MGDPGTQLETDVFERTVCPVGGARGGLEAMRQVERLRAGDSTVVLVTVAESSDDAAPVEGLVHASEDADLVVGGSRGLHGIRSLGCVSERVAHRAACSVLVVRVAGSTSDGEG